MKEKGPRGLGLKWDEFHCTKISQGSTPIMLYKHMPKHIMYKKKKKWIIGIVFYHNASQRGGRPRYIPEKSLKFLRTSCKLWELMFFFLTFGPSPNILEAGFIIVICESRNFESYKPKVTVHKAKCKNLTNQLGKFINWINTIQCHSVQLIKTISRWAHQVHDMLQQFLVFWLKMIEHLKRAIRSGSQILTHHKLPLKQTFQKLL